MPEASGARVVFDHVWKKFRRGESHDSLRDLIPALVRRAVGRRQAPAELDATEFWALRDVCFEVQHGEALGIIGANGAGKSTVLKLLTRILRPTRGTARVSGRVGALIELAAGFHPDLTGRENVYLQGTMMGMRRVEIARKFDEIVDFSEIAEFIDTPVKRYSSGMHARLGFAIAAHLDPDVLIVDEVLAVGDWAFQVKAFNRLKAMVNRDVAVVVVSHQLDRVSALCTHGMLLEHGRVACAGTPATCIEAYIRPAAPEGDRLAGLDLPARVDTITRLTERAVRPGERVRLLVTGSVTDPSERTQLYVTIDVRSVQTGELVFATTTLSCGVALPRSGPFAFELELQMNVAPGTYIVETGAWDQRRQAPLMAGPVASVDVEDTGSFIGTVQLNPVIRVRSPARTAVGDYR